MTTVCCRWSCITCKGVRDAFIGDLLRCAWCCNRRIVPSPPGVAPSLLPPTGSLPRLTVRVLRLFPLVTLPSYPCLCLSPMESPCTGPLQGCRAGLSSAGVRSTEQHGKSPCAPVISSSCAEGGYAPSVSCFSLLYGESDQRPDWLPKLCESWEMPACFYPCAQLRVLDGCPEHPHTPAWKQTWKFLTTRDSLDFSG